MSKLIAVQYVSFDGVMQSPGRPDEDTRNGFAQGGWASSRLALDPEAAQASMGGEGTTTAMLFGRRTYEDLVGHWLSSDQPNPFTDILRDTPKYVASTTLHEPLQHPNSTLLSGDLDRAVAGLKDDGSADGEIIVLGSGTVVRTLAAAHLIDRYILTFIPIVLGGGTKLFADTFAELDPVDTFVSPTGIIVGTYSVRPATDTAPPEDRNEVTVDQMS